MLKPEADGRLRRVFAKIGSPPDRPFQPDSFQLKAIAAVRTSDCLVSAPTGAGKTWIAQEAIRHVREKGGRAWYASPLKALSNAKFVEFREVFGPDHVGILTGDRKENADAPVIVGTTEILRNQLYDAMYEGADLYTDLVILDEAHFLGDEDRGVVWEEVMIYLPERIPLLLLSATIGNATQIADWLESIRFKPCKVIEEKTRPVPLFPLFFHPAGKLLPLLGNGGLDKKVRDFLNSPNPAVLNSPRQLPPFSQILGVLNRFHLLPAIFFMKSRADCDAALDRCIDWRAPRKARVEDRGQGELHKNIEEFTEEHRRLRGHRQMWHLRNAGVAAHHSGQLPAWKMLVEQLMTKGLLEAVFATSTVAAGVNFPARSVVFLNSDRYNGLQFVPLDGTEFHQATGRAGRRGKDRIGFAVVLPGKFMDVPLMAALCTAPPEDVCSQIKVNFSMVLNLLLSHNPEQIKDIFQRSFGTYLNMKNQQPGLHKKLKETGRRLMALLPKALCGGGESVVNLTRQWRSARDELCDLQHKIKMLQSRLSKLASLQPGRLFLDQRGRLYCALQWMMKRREKGVLACRIKKRPPARGQRIRTRWVGPQKVSQVLDAIVELPPLDNPRKVRSALIAAAREAPPPALMPLPLGQKEKAQLRPLKNRCVFLQKQLDAQICRSCSHLSLCHGKTKGRFRHVLEDFAQQWDAANAVRMTLWGDFVKHLEFLKEEGFVTDQDRLTDDGIWASKLRLDQPLMIAEGLRKGGFPDSGPVLLAALIAPFVHDRDVEERLEPSKMSADFLRGFKKIKRALAPLVERKVIHGFEARPISQWAGAAIFAWAKGSSWEDLVKITGVSEGDLSMLILRTGENLRQIASLTQEYPRIARCAAQAMDRILREPVLMP